MGNGLILGVPQVVLSGKSMVPGHLWNLSLVLGILKVGLRIMVWF